MNPYSDADFFSFFTVFFQRLWLIIQGKISIQGLASDEIQLIVISLVAISSALVGSYLVLKKMTMLANSLSHTILLGIIAAYLLLLPFTTGLPILGLKTFFIAALVTGLATTLLTQLLTNVLRLQEDASIGLVFSTLFALGVVLVTLFTRNTHLGVEAIMGNADALHADDIQMIFWITCGNLFCILLFYKQFQIAAFDPALARALGCKPNLFNYLLMIQTAATSIGAFRSVGVLLVLAFLVAPSLSAKLFVHRLKNLLWLSAGIGVGSTIIGVALSRHFLTVHEIPLSTGGLIVAMIALVYLLLLMIKSAITTYSSIYARNV